jgi:hypothetical protein
MNLQLPEGANVQIFIGNSSPPTISDQLEEVTARSRGRGLNGATLKITTVFALVVGGFWAGEQRGQAAVGDTGLSAPPAVQQTFPTQVLPSQAADTPPQSGPPQIPPAFQAQLNQQPSIQPPPGKISDPAGGAQNPFGLNN